jgi:hypothetical protein
MDCKEKNLVLGYGSLNTFVDLSGMVQPDNNINRK